ncbi:phospholipase A [Thiorhodococcus mannitoliphagus]|uniref:Phospholipase A1 n=1 Tax=Thiorhodococcus mannitoliphagus TaxID=329406 RepID=A0A6P1DSL8_9GAMM|nr:phospholipase A [Thiorhodococcus mannitoliphagus]NEX19012.1 phospholipase A [Thiorhodococcus mannitoliphagus]
MPNQSHRNRPTLIVAVMLGIAAMIGGPALAQTQAANLADCATIALDQERLACYDRLSGRAATIAEAPPSSEPMAAPVVLPTTRQNNTQQPNAPIIAATGSTSPASASLIDAAWGFDPDSSRYTIDVYRPNYLLFGSYSSRPNEAPFLTLFDAAQNPNAELNSTEAEFQISFKTRLWATDDRRFGIWAAYTQQSQWQIYNADLSRPFRETNYMPELMASFRPNLSLGGFNWRLLNVGYTHQSNGRSDPISRSWDRLFAEFGVERDGFALLIRPWVVIDDGEDDNPNITDYYGYGDITAFYRWRENSFSLMARGNPSTDKGAAQITWTSPRIIGPLRGYIKGFTGYGESLIDYDWKQNVIGIGVTLNDQL